MVPGCLHQRLRGGGEQRGRACRDRRSCRRSVTVHPANQTDEGGRTASFTATVAARRAPTVQWQTSANDGSTWNDISGATSTTYTFTATTAAHGMWFRAVFTNIDGQLASGPATLTVRSVSGSDFDGDATTDIAVYRRTTGFWYVGNDQWVRYGGPGDVPVAGDYNGDGTTDIAVYQPSTGFWYVRDQFWTQFGEPGDMPVPGDYDGDGTTDLAVYRPVDGRMVRAQPAGHHRVRRSRLHAGRRRLRRRRHRPTSRSIDRPQGSGTCATASRSSSAGRVTCLSRPTTTATARRISPSTGRRPGCGSCATSSP